MYYFIIALSTIMFSVQFMFNNNYQKENGNGIIQSINFSLYTSVFGLVILLIINNFKFEMSLFSFMVAIVYSLVILLTNYSSIKAFSYANLSVYSVFSMIGGMILPFLYGVLKGEEIKFLRILCIVLITISILMTISDNKHSKKAIKYYIAVFFFNGLVGVLSSFHQSFDKVCVDSSSFLMLTKIITTVMCLILLLFQKNKSLVISKKSLLLCFYSAGLNSIANLLLLIALLHIPTSVQYPIVTGGTIVCATLIDKIRKTQVSKKELIAAAVALISSILMAF